MKTLLNLALIATFGLASAASAVEKSPVVRKFVLVGVISDDVGKKKPDGIAVIKDVESKMTLTIKTGQTLPYSSLKVKRIERQLVILSDGPETFEVRHEGTTEDDKKEEVASKDFLESDLDWEDWENFLNSDYAEDDKPDIDFKRGQTYPTVDLPLIPSPRRSVLEAKSIKVKCGVDGCEEIRVDETEEE